MQVTPGIIIDGEEIITTPVKAEKKSGKRIGYNYIIIKSLKESRKNDVVKCLYIKSLVNFGFCVIKEGSYGETKDKLGRDIRDRLIWQQQLHTDLQDKLKLPRLLGSFEENGNYYLVMQYIRGKSFYSKIKKTGRDLPVAIRNGEKTGLLFLDYLKQITQLLETLHKHNYVHRDVTPANFMVTTNGAVYVIDMELSYSLDNKLEYPFQWGTQGYMSPGQKATESPLIQDDVFSIGAILLQVLSGIHPLKLTDSSIEELESKLYFLIADQQLAALLLKCLHPDPLERPHTQHIQQALLTYKNDLQKKVTRPASPLQALFTKEQIMDVVQQTIITLSTPLLADEERGWFAEDLHADANNEKNKINKAWYASFNLGASGVMYFISKAHEAGLDITSALPFFDKGVQLIQERYINRLTESRPGLHFGASGIAVSLTAAMQQGLLNTSDTHIDWINRILEKENTDLTIENGIAGQGIAHFACLPYLDPLQAAERLQQYATELLYKQQPDGSWIRGITDKKAKKTRGIATGVAGII